MGAYVMSKHAQEALTEVLALEATRFGIRVAAIEPGVILTPILEKALARPPLTDSPYTSHADRITRFFLTALGAPTMPEAVADTVWHAITTDDPQLRYTVGPDAEKLVEAFAAMGSDEWLAHHNDPDDEAWARFFGDVSGVAM
jgi:NAD(P)-dependent dehydrogenase (short-subunit alcohol dehydrogenase family)